MRFREVPESEKGKKRGICGMDEYFGRMKKRMRPNAKRFISRDRVRHLWVAEQLIRQFQRRDPYPGRPSCTNSRGGNSRCAAAQLCKHLGTSVTCLPTSCLIARMAWFLVVVIACHSASQPLRLLQICGSSSSAIGRRLCTACLRVFP